MIRQAASICCALLLFIATRLEAHELALIQGDTQAMSLTLNYADGTPFAYESYELYPTNAELPVQVGRTDAQGRVVFIPDTTGEWRIKAVSEDGHGIDRHFTIDTVTAAGQASACGRPNRLHAIVTGLGVLFGLFGLYQMFFRRRANAQ